MQAKNLKTIILINAIGDKDMKHPINIIITAVLLSLTSTAMANTKPYCTVASSEGSQ
jgi:hypothetical protein